MGLFGKKNRKTGAESAKAAPAGEALGEELLDRVSGGVSVPGAAAAPDRRVTPAPPRADRHLPLAALAARRRALTA